MSGAENPQREKETDSPSFKGFHAQFNCKVTYGNKNQAQLTMLYYVKFRVQKQSRNYEKYNQTVNC